MAAQFDDRIRKANGNVDLPGYTGYYEIIASQAGNAAVQQLWNSVYHRLPMMRHRAIAFGYGDMASAHAAYPANSIPTMDPWHNTPSGNGYATIEYASDSVPVVSASWWPSNLTSGVPRSFSTNTESPDPIGGVGVDAVGSPLHVIFPTGGSFGKIEVSFSTHGAHFPCYVLYGGGGSPTAAGDVASADLLPDTQGLLTFGEVFIMAKDPLFSSAPYDWSVTINNGTFSVGPQTFTTAP